MNYDFAAAMRRAARATRANNVIEATRVIRDALTGRPVPARIRKEPVPDAASERQSESPAPDPIEAEAKLVEPSATPGFSSRRPLGEVLRVLREGRLRSGAFESLPEMNLPGLKRTSAPSAPMPDGAAFLTRSYSCAAGRRDYKLYVPASAPAKPRGLVVMLHGCKQNPDDFAAGTNMNAAAETHGLMVAYPGQARSANTSSCWNWFSPHDQMRDKGEPSIIAGITREIMSEFNLDRHQVFAAGLSAGGAMAAVMSETYPDIYAAVGIHSGLPYASAKDVVSAFAAMRGDSSPPRSRAATGAKGQVRTIVFHGGADQTVHPSNAARIVEAAIPHAGSGHAQQSCGGESGGRAYTRTVVADAAGIPVVEHWLINGAGHAWSGGHSSGSYSDPQGPDASMEMMRFFLNQPAGGGSS